MGFKALSTVRSGATSAVSKQATVINTSQGFAATGGAITGSTTINVEVVTPGQGTDVTPVSGGGISITSVDYLNANGSISTANAVSTSGGNIKINGSGFTDPMTVIVGSSALSNANVSVANSTAIIASLGSASPGNVSIFAFSSSNAGSQLSNAVRYSGVPEWTTSAITLTNNAESNVALVAASDSTLTYTLQVGSSLPDGMSLISSGYISGTPTGYSSTTVLTPVIIATDSEGQATQQTITITIATAEPYFPYTTLLLNGDTGTNLVNNATNNVFVDSSSNNFTVTRTGTTTQGSFSPFSQTGWSNYFNGTTSYSSLTTAAIGTNQFTVEAWVYLTSNSNYSAVFSSWVSTTASIGILLGFLNTGVLYGGLGNGGAADVVTGATAVTTNTWHHVAITRNASNTVTLWLDGVSLGTVQSTKTTNATTTHIGKYYTNTSQYYLPGYISNLRVVNGAALYTSNFTPSDTPLTAVANTLLLTCQSNRFVDNSSNNYTITAAGSPSVQAFSPFSPSSAYSPSTSGGAAYLDGSGNYLSLATNAAFNITSGSTDSFICEGWVYWTTVAANMSIFDNGGLNSVSFANWSITLNASSQITLNWASSGSPGSTIGTLPTSIVPVTGQWYHIAFVKTNADWALFVNGTRATNFSGLNTASKTSATALYIGYGIATSAAGGNAFKGYISNVRIYKGASGSAPYSATSTTITVPPAPVTAITNTSLLANFTNGGIVDAHSTTALQTVGDTKLSTAVTKFGTASMYFDGTGDYLTAPVSANNSFGTGNFTFEMWFNTTARTQSYPVLINNDSSISFAANQWSLQEGRSDYANKITFWCYNMSSTLPMLTSSTLISTGTWYYVAVTRSGSTLRLFINGNLEATATSSASLDNNIAKAFNVSSQTTSSYNGYIDDLRITKGFARYTANFIPPTTGFLGQ